MPIASSIAKQLGASVAWPITGRSPGALDRIFGAGGLDYAYWDFTKTDRTFQWPNSGGTTLADDPGEAVGLWLGRGGQGIKTFSQVMSGQPERLQLGAIMLLGSATPATYSTSTGAGTVTRVDASNQSGVTFPAIVNRIYAIDITPNDIMWVRDIINGNILLTINGGARKTVHVKATTTALILAATTATTTSFTVHSFKEAPSHSALQDTAGFKGVRQVGGIKFDGSDDREITDWTGNNHNQPNIIMWDCEIPATLATSHFVAGSVSSGFGNNFIVGFGAAGTMRANIGGSTENIGPAVTPGSRVICAVHSTGVGTGGKAYLSDGGSNNGLVGTFPAITPTISGTMPTWLMGAYSNDGVPSGFFGGAIRRLSFGKMPTFNEAEFVQIVNEWRNAA